MCKVHTDTYCFSKQVIILPFTNRPFKLALPWQQLLPVEAGSLFLLCCVLFPMTKLLREAVQLLRVTTIKQETALQKRLEGVCFILCKTICLCVCVCVCVCGGGGIFRVCVHVKNTALLSRLFAC